MNTKTFFTAAALTVLPMAASAMTIGVIADDGSTNLLAGEDITATFIAVGQGGAGDFQHTFTLADEGTGDALVTINDNTVSQFTGLVAQWLNAADKSVLATIVLDGIVDTLSTSFTENPDTLSQILSISWTDSVKGAGFDGTVTVSTVPVPAGLLLMGTALAGLGLTRRKA